jgi:hypothetical protein
MVDSSGGRNAELFWKGFHRFRLGNCRTWGAGNWLGRACCKAKRGGQPDEAPRWPRWWHPVKLLAGNGDGNSRYQKDEHGLHRSFCMVINRISFRSYIEINRKQMNWKRYTLILAWISCGVGVCWATADCWMTSPMERWVLYMFDLLLNPTHKCTYS